MSRTWKCSLIIAAVVSGGPIAALYAWAGINRSDVWLSGFAGIVGAVTFIIVPHMVIRYKEQGNGSKGR